MKEDAKGNDELRNEPLNVMKKKYKNSRQSRRSDSTYWTKLRGVWIPVATNSNPDSTFVNDINQNIE